MATILSFCVVSVALPSSGIANRGKRSARMVKSIKTQQPARTVPNRTPQPQNARLVSKRQTHAKGQPKRVARSGALLRTARNRRGVAENALVFAIASIGYLGGTFAFALNNPEASSSFVSVTNGMAAVVALVSVAWHGYQSGKEAARKEAKEVSEGWIRYQNRTKAEEKK